jgi:putrescine transport system substrate-binding protein
VFDSNEVLETKLLAGSTGYDIVVPTGTFLANQIKAGVFQKLDKSKLPNLANMDPAIAERLEKYDPGNEYAINYMWGTTGLGINVDMVKERLGRRCGTEHLGPLFDQGDRGQARRLRRLHARRADRNGPGRAQLSGHGSGPEGCRSPSTRPRNCGPSVRPHVRKFHSSEYINALANGDICLAVGWSGDVLQARDRAAEADAGVTVEYIIPKEGRADVVRQHGHPRRCGQCRGSA